MNSSFNIYEYDHYIVLFSGGKDSTACFLCLLHQRVPKRKIELWHHLVDGRGQHFIDWECTEDYCRKFAAAFGIPIFFSWKEKGFEGEMLRYNRPTKPNWFETPEGVFKSGGLGKPNTRLLFPQLSENLAVRWCSSYLKIDVGKTALINQKRFESKRILILSGERAQESFARKHHAYFEKDPSDNRSGKKNIRHVNRWRPVHQWSERQIWGIIRHYKVVPHPCYYLGYHRCSCKFCIFGSPNQIATSAFLSPVQFKKITQYEKGFSKTIHPGIDLKKYSEKGIIFNAVHKHSKIAIQAVSPIYTLPIFTDNWNLPDGAVTDF
jgi:3'-phosphoadenosine 5'-phosphosulfate sulfotransferase (PAPS reductase)/FAD synthetase